MHIKLKNSDCLLRILQFEQKFPTLLILPQVQKLILKNDPTLEELVSICQSNKSLFNKLTRSATQDKDIRQFAQDILLKKGMAYLMSICIRSMNQEIFILPIKTQEGLTEFMLKRRSIILARYLKKFSSNVGYSPDDTYLCGLFYNFRIVCYGLLLETENSEIPDFVSAEGEVSKTLAECFMSLNFNKKISDFIQESCQDVYDTHNPFLHALVRIGNQLLCESEISGSTTFRNTSNLDPMLVELTGLSVRELVDPLKEVVKDFKGGANRP
jgi:hypothetical protein